MKKKYLFAALLLSMCMTAPCTVQASDEKAGTIQEAAAEKTAESEESETDTTEESAGESTESDATGDDAAASDSADSSSEEETTASEEDDEEELERPEYKALDYVTPGNYKNLSVNFSDLGISRVTDEDVENDVTDQLKSLAESADGVIEKLTEGKVQSGDVANIDYVGKKDGEAFDGGSAEGYDLEIGSGTFIDGFEDGLIGAAIGDTVDLNLTFPENYSSTDLAGQDVVFTVTVNSVERMPEITDDLVNTVTDGEYKDLESYREYRKNELETSKEEEIQSAAQEAAFSQVQEASDISGYPDGLQEYTEQYIRDYYKSYAQMYGMELADFLSAALGVTEDEFNEQLADAATETMKSELCIKAILESEGIEVTEDDLTKIAQSYGFESTDAMKEEASSAQMESIYLGMLKDKAYSVIGDTLTIIEDAADTEADTEDSSEESTDDHSEDAAEEAAEGEAEDDHAEE